MDFIKGEVSLMYAKQHNLSINNFIYLDQNIFISSVAANLSEKASMGNCFFIGLNNTLVGYSTRLAGEGKAAFIIKAEKGVMNDMLVFIADPSIV